MSHDKQSIRIAEQLGMSHGAACTKLKKNILFNLLCRLKENVCFKCGEVIESAKELSIEHKMPWEGRSADLFWDIENTSFSHAVCNRPHSAIASRTKDAPDGEIWCSNCKAYKTFSNFHKNSGNACGFQNYCKQCRDKRVVA